MLFGKKHILNSSLLVHYESEVTAAAVRWTLKIYCLPFSSPPPFLLEMEETRNCVVVPLNHLGIDLHKTINRNYSEFRERRTGRRVMGDKQLPLQLPITASYSFLSQEAGRWKAGLYLMYFQVINIERIIVSSTVVSAVQADQSWSCLGGMSMLGGGVKLHVAACLILESGRIWLLDWIVIYLVFVVEKLNNAGSMSRDLIYRLLIL